MRGGVNIMLIIPIKDGENIDRALKRYKRKFDLIKQELFVSYVHVKLSLSHL